jgi:hypothetical protein
VIIQPATLQSQSKQWVVLELPKCIVVLSREAFIQGIRRGKWWKRHKALQEQLLSTGGEEYGHERG